MLLSVTAGFSVTAQATSVGTVSGLTVESKTTTTVKLKWKKVKKATGYQVYYSTSKNKNYKKAKSITKGKTVTAKITKLKSNKKYYFKVRAVKGKNKGKFSSVVSAKTKMTTAQKVKKKLINGYLYMPWLHDMGLYEYQFKKDGTFAEYNYVPIYNNGKSTGIWEKWYYVNNGTKKYNVYKGTYKIKDNKITLTYSGDYPSTELIIYDTKMKLFRTQIWEPDPEFGIDYYSYGKYTYKENKMKTSKMEQYWQEHSGKDNIVKYE